ncbi:hypothetical protein PQQ99_33740 [Paraburkholderia sediminicola]|uniref:hypothetical protein n=1 Tax=Paraburkholderia sediminicola TaxID=458836 RepID=UPI0038B7B489
MTNTPSLAGSDFAAATDNDRNRLIADALSTIKEIRLKVEKENQSFRDLYAQALAQLGDDMPKGILEIKAFSDQVGSIIERGQQAANAGTAATADTTLPAVLRQSVKRKAV